MKKAFLLPILCLLMSSALFAESDSLDSKVKLSLGVLGGWSNSWIEATGLTSKYFAPTSHVEEIFGPSLATEFEVRIGKSLAASVGLKYVKKGQNTKETQVYFADNIYEHELETTAEMWYLEMPVIVKAGLNMSRFWAYVRVGGVPAKRMGSSLAWSLDGSEAPAGTPYVPTVDVDQLDGAVLVGAEIGTQVRRHGFFVCADFEIGLMDIEHQLEGEAYNRMMDLKVGYRLFF